MAANYDVRQRQYADISKWLACGLRCGESGNGRAGRVKVCDTETHEKVLDIQGHTNSVFSIHIAPVCRQDCVHLESQMTRRAAQAWRCRGGSAILSGQLVTVTVVATATAKNPDAKSIRIYNSDDGWRLLDIPFSVNRHVSSSLAWSADGHQLFAVSYSEVKCFDSSSGSLLGQWFVPGGGSSASLALSRN